MRQTISTFMNRRGMPIDCLSHSDSKIRKHYETLICGGGELGDEAYFTRAFSLCKQPSNMRIIGLGPFAGLHLSGPDILSRLKEVPSISVRSKWAKSYLSDLLDRSDIRYSPDIAFSLASILSSELSKPRSKCHKNKDGTVGINIVPYGCSILRDGRIVKDKAWYSMLDTLYPEKADYHAKLTENYIAFIHNLIDDLNDQGYRVVNVALSFGDYVFAKTLFSDTNIKIASPAKTAIGAIRLIGSLDVLYACRFHSYVFAMLARTPFKQFAYAMKCVHLLNDLGIKTESGYLLDRDKLATLSPLEAARLHLESPTQFLSNSALQYVSEMSVDSLESLAQSIGCST